MKKNGLIFSCFTTTLAALLIASAAALPVLTVSSSQSNANYQLNASFRTFQNCSASPDNYSGVACGTTSFQAFVSANDDGQCTLGDQNCRFSPDNVTIGVGGFVVWQNYGRLNHTVTSDSPSYPINLLLRAFYGYNQTNFATAGTFKYHDSLYPWMNGTVIIIQPVAPPPRVQVFNLTGPVGWIVVGLDGENALLSISHQLKLYNVTANPQKLLLSESGIIEDSIELSTREESVNIGRILSTVPYLYGYIYGNPYLVGYGGSPFTLTGGGISGGPTIPTGGPSFPYPYPIYYPPAKSYTTWWVNGPLSLGDTLEVQSLTGSVRGSESLSLGGTIGSKDAWIVGSQFAEQYSQQPPTVSPGQFYPTYFIANQSIATSEQFDYGKQSDLLLKSSDTTDQFFQFATLYPPGASLYGGYYPYPGPIWFRGVTPLHETVVVTRTQDTSISISLKLVSSNINLSKNASPPPSSGGSGSTVQSALSPMLYTATGLVAAAMVAGAVWLVLRARKKSQLPGNGPAQLPTDKPVEPAPQIST